MKSFVEQFVEKPENMRAFQQERLISEMTERICQLMEERNISRAELARKLGTSKSYITQLLDGRANMTLRKLADIFTALGCAIDLQTRSLVSTVSPSVSIDLGQAQWRTGSLSYWIEPPESKASAA